MYVGGEIMVEYPTLEEILAQNPHIDKEEFKKRLEILDKLRNFQTKGSRYNLALPFTRRHVSIDEESGIDPRTVTLRHPR